MVIFLFITTILLLGLLITASFYLWKFAKIIMIFEDDLSEAINSLNEVEDSINKVLSMQMFFDSPEVKQAVQKVLEQIKLCRLSMQKVVQRFTARSKQQYVTVWEDTPTQEEILEQFEEMPRLPGQPPGTPNPLEAIRREGIVLDVGRTRKR